MSTYITEIIHHLRTRPQDWRPACALGENRRGERDIYGVTNGSIRISCVGNSAVWSILDVAVDKKQTPTTYLDRFRLERAVQRWYRNAPLVSYKGDPA